MKKIAIVITHPIQYYSPVFSLLAKHQIDVKVFYTWGNMPRNQFDPGFGKKVEWDIPLFEGYDYVLLKNISKDAGPHHFMGVVNEDAIERIEDFQPNAVLIYGWNFYSHLKIIRYFTKKIPVWFRGDSTLLNPLPYYKKVLRRIRLTWVYKHIDKAFYVGSANRDYFLKYGMKPDQLYFSPHAIDNARFGEDRSKEALNLRHSLNVKDNEILIMYAGKFETQKAVPSLINAFIKLAKQDTKLMVVGDGKMYPEINLLAQNNKNIHVLPFVNQKEIPIYYQACDLFCLPSVSESWGLVVNEAMAAGKAVLVSERAGSCYDLVIKDVNGLTFDPGNENALIGSLDKLLVDKNNLKAMGKKSSEIIQKYNFESQVEEIIKNLQKT